MKSGDGPQEDRGALGRYRFDAIEVDAAAHTLVREGQAQALEPKAFAVLLANICTPLLDSMTRPAVYGTRSNSKGG